MKTIIFFLLFLLNFYSYSQANNNDTSIKKIGISIDILESEIRELKANYSSGYLNNQTDHFLFNLDSTLISHINSFKRLKNNLEKPKNKVEFWKFTLGESITSVKEILSSLENNTIKDINYGTVFSGSFPGSVVISFEIIDDFQLNNTLSTPCEKMSLYFINDILIGINIDFEGFKSNFSDYEKFYINSISDMEKYFNSKNKMIYNDDRTVRTAIIETSTILITIKDVIKGRFDAFSSDIVIKLKE